MKNLRERLSQALEELYVALFAWIPTPIGILLRLFAWKYCFRQCGKARFGTALTLTCMKNISVGDGCRIGRLCFLTAQKGVLELADNVDRKSVV